MRGWLQKEYAMEEQQSRRAAAAQPAVPDEPTPTLQPDGTVFPPVTPDPPAPPGYVDPLVGLELEPEPAARAPERRLPARVQQPGGTRRAPRGEADAYWRHARRGHEQPARRLRRPPRRRRGARPDGGRHQHRVRDPGLPRPDGKRRVQPMQYAEFVGSSEARQRYWARSYVGWQRFSTAGPNEGHRAVAALQRAGLVGSVITQNVDGLHQAGERSTSPSSTVPWPGRLPDLWRPHQPDGPRRADA